MATLFLVAGLVALLPAGARADTTATVTSPDGVNLRGGPGTTYPVLQTLPAGTTVTVTGDPTDDNWWPVSVNGAGGYILGDYLSINQPRDGSASAPAPRPATALSGPGAPPPTATPTPATAPLYAPVASPSPAPTPRATPAPAPAPTPGGSMPPAPTASDGVYATVVPPDGLNLRSGPATTFPIVTAVPGGARVQIVGRATPDGWYSVVYNNKLGWVDGRYLSFSPVIPAPPPPPGVTNPSAPSRFIWPVESRKISTVFSASHPGVDIDEFPDGGNPAIASAAGTVTFAGGSTCCSYGLYVIVKHADGYTTLYAHLSSISVTEGQELKQSQLVGKTGNTGFSTGAHLHFEIRKDGVAIDPLSVLPGAYTIE